MPQCPADHWLWDSVSQKCRCKMVPENMESFPITICATHVCGFHDLIGDIGQASAFQISIWVALGNENFSMVNRRSLLG